jgi:hypothetical protein
MWPIFFVTGESLTSEKSLAKFWFCDRQLVPKIPIKKMGWNIIGYLPQSVQGESSTAKPKIRLCVFKEKVSFPFKLLAYIGIEKLCYEMK